MPHKPTGVFEQDKPETPFHQYSSWDRKRKSHTHSHTPHTPHTLPHTTHSHTHTQTHTQCHNRQYDSFPLVIVIVVVVAVVVVARNNHIRALPQELEKCSKIREIVLSYNQFAMLPPVLYSLKALENIIAHDNQVILLTISACKCELTLA